MRDSGRRQVAPPFRQQGEAVSIRNCNVILKDDMNFKVSRPDSKRRRGKAM